MAIFRRRQCLVAFWVGEALRVENYITKRVTDLKPTETAVLAALSSWRRVDEIVTRLPSLTGRRVSAVLETLLARDLIESSDGPRLPEKRFDSIWRDWSPSAAFFHFGTKGGRYGDQASNRELLRLRLLTERPPEMLRRRRGAVVRLPPFPTRGTLPAVLLARRSWRDFGQRAVTLPELSALAGLTWGVQRWARISPELEVPLKTSPSGGACHSIEVYFAVRRVRGLEPGLYHYRPDAHELVRLRKGWTGPTIARRLGRQRWFADCSVVALMTSAFERVRFKYRFPRAYRVILLEAGHFCQTFCLVATWLGLAPFCTAALADSEIERDLSIDGISESVLYAAGVGSRPHGRVWAPWPDAKDTPQTRAPMHSRRSRRSRAQ